MIFYDLDTLARIIPNLKEKIRYELFDNIMQTHKSIIDDRFA